MYFSRPIATSEIIYLPQGTISEIITYLKERNSNINSVDKYALAIIGHPQSGWIDINSKKLSKLDFLYRITTAKAAMSEVTLIPGETTAIFLQDVARKLNLSEKILNEQYNKAYSKGDGFFIPETYKIPIGINEEQFVSHLANLSKKRHKELAVRLLGKYDEKEWDRYLIIASVIQKEAANEEEMPIVASVVYNRLKIGMRLQMDGTLNYGLHSHETITAKRIREDMSKFNTYLNDGLPPSPVCTVSTAALKAAISPATTEFLYFMRDKKTGKHKFTKTLDEHNEVIRSQK